MPPGLRALAGEGPAVVFQKRKDYNGTRRHGTGPGERREFLCGVR